MNYAFKMMAVVLALGVLVLQGCQTQTSSYLAGAGADYNNHLRNYFVSNKSYPSKVNVNNSYKSITSFYASWSDSKICKYASRKSHSYRLLSLTSQSKSLIINEAKRRGLDCGYG
ncbi:hypothetical protein N8014_05410, partial [Pseudomonadota bacterium]|nr:hypothetical protein [Pseudomonadota bacterium]